MPRLRKEMVDQIKGLMKEGFIDVEIHDKTEVSLPTIRKIRKNVEDVIEVGKGKDMERVELFDLKGKKIAFEDVINVEQFKDFGILKEATLDNVTSEIYSETEALKEYVYGSLVHEVQSLKTLLMRLKK